MSRRLAARAATLGGVLALGATLAWAGERASIFDRFDHAVHEKALARASVSCLVCHQVGGRADGLNQTQMADTWLVAPAASCHECHAPGAGGIGSGVAASRAPRACGTCHDTLPLPVSHVAGWEWHHGTDATAPDAGCSDCHDRQTCVGCHDRRENTQLKVHDASWLSVHGIAAGSAPASCDSCHVRTECTNCHGSDAGFGRSR